jgi:hypothetical protein
MQKRLYSPALLSVAIVVAIALLSWTDRGNVVFDPFGPVRVQAQPQFSSPISCTQSKVIDTATAATVELVPLVAGQRVHVCGFVFQSAAATTAKLVTGHGTLCATGQANLTGPFTFTTTPSQAALGGGAGSIAMTLAGDALCVVNSQAVQLSGVVSYIQF